MKENKVKHRCPICESVVYESGAVDEEGKHRWIDRKYERFIEHDEEGRFIPCRDCGKKYRMKKVGKHKEGPEIWQVLGLKASPD